MHLVWFKRDLRLADHRPLAAAIDAAGISGHGVVCLYVHEPDYWQLRDTDVRHLTFINTSLTELRQQLRRVGGELILRTGDVLDVFQALHREHSIDTLHSHEETGNHWTYQRDIAVGDWCKTQNIAWTEEVQNGVIRRLGTRDGWAKRWNARMTQPLTPPPTQIPTHPVKPVGRVPSPPALGLPKNLNAKYQQTGGVTPAHELLRTFLSDRGETYHKSMSSPVTAFEQCSRLSTHIAYGNLSMRQIYQSVAARRDELRDRKKRDGPESVGTWLAALNAYSARLRWHCHFMQKLEDQPSIEWENMNRSYDKLREPQPDPQRLQAWIDGRTGYPMVDACMRCVAVTGYLNFRMRAMIVSFSSYHLWLHWYEPAIYLARVFTDYEPGIHFAQHQMQSGTTGINTARIYSPIKQVIDQDPGGKFIRHWLPELRRIPDKYLSQPEKMPSAIQQEFSCEIGKDYPPPIVDHKTAYAAARENIRSIRRETTTREEAEQVLKKHGSRKRPPKRTPPRPKK